MILPSWEFWLGIIVGIIIVVVAFLLWLLHDDDPEWDIPPPITPSYQYNIGNLYLTPNKRYIQDSLGNIIDRYEYIDGNRSVSMIPALEKLEEILVDITGSNRISIHIDRDTSLHVDKSSRGMVGRRVCITRWGCRTDFKDVKSENIKDIKLICENIDLIIEKVETERRLIDDKEKAYQESMEKMEKDKAEAKIRTEEISKCCIEKMKRLGY